jgi:tRNA A-37 threonylcarbamoyl transferase component Bud32
MLTGTWDLSEGERRAMAIGSRFLLGRYEVGALLGSGGMAEVFEGHDRVLARRVAIKVLHSQYARNPAFVERFKREARAVASLTHAGIVGVYDTGEQAGTHFIVMEFVEGRTLADILEDGGPLDPARAARIIGAVASALGAAHARGLIHRDVKPANVMVAPRGELTEDIKIMDFGIARLAAAAGLTETSNVIGTARYMSPEQAQAHEIDGRADIYSLGVCLYECLTGQAPFSGDSPVAVATKHVHTPPRPPRELRPEVPPALEVITLTAMAKRPADRYQTAGDLRDDIERALAGQPIQARVPARKPRRPVDEAVDDELWLRAGEAGRSGEQTPPPRIRVPARPVWVDRVAGAGRRPRLSAIGLGLVLVLVLAGLLSAQARRAGTEATQTTQAASGPLVVPYLVRYPEAAARALLLQKGFNVAGQVRRQADRRVQAGSVIGTIPPAGAEIGTDRPVVLVVSSGSQGQEVPLVVGQQLVDARRYLMSLGFTVTARPVSSTQPLGTVIEQDPLGGTLVSAPGRIVLHISGRVAPGGAILDPMPGGSNPQAGPGQSPPPGPPASTTPPTTTPPTTAPPTTTSTTLPNQNGDRLGSLFSGVPA